jgi:single-strand DNA-binding protein
MNDLITSIIRASQHTFVGRIGGDPEIKYLDGGSSVTKASMAINRPGSRKGDRDIPPDWFTLEIWNDEAQQFADTIRKGDLVEVRGRVKSNRYTSKQTGEEKTELIVTVQDFELLTRKDGPAAPARSTAPAQQPDEEDIPF